HDKYPGHWRVYGSSYTRIQELITDDPTLATRIHPDYEYCIAEVVWACRNEMVVKLEDFLARRIRLLLLDAQASLVAAPTVAQVMARELDHDNTWVSKELDEYRILVKN
ncbi:MAG: glycerol-3-phosphate dehydrogenase C-terminal domain-containing protein, partial [Sphingobacterium sp.]